MPTYEYLCGACRARHEIYQSITEKPKRKCPSCGKPALERQISAGAGFLFKGQGFYITDYRSESYKAGQQAEQSGHEPPAGAGPAKDKDGASKPDATKEPAKSAEPTAKPSKPPAPRARTEKRGR